MDLNDEKQETNATNPSVQLPRISTNIQPNTASEKINPPADVAITSDSDKDKDVPVALNNSFEMIKNTPEKSIVPDCPSEFETAPDITGSLEAASAMPVTPITHSNNPNADVAAIACVTDIKACASGGNSAPPGQLSARKKGWPRGRKRRCLPKDAPKAPLSGYMLYMAAQREELRLSESPPSFAELAKIVAHKWAGMDAAQKQKYLDASEVEKERYQKELLVYTKTDSYKNFMAQQKQQEESLADESAVNINAAMTTPNKLHMEDLTAPHKTPIEDEASTPPDTKRPRRECPSLISNGIVTQAKDDSDDFSFYDSSLPLEIPIFTEQFLRHNKGREAELRQLRKSNAECEEQNALLHKHIDSCRLSLQRYEAETAELKKKSEALQRHLSKLREDLAAAFTSTPAPGWTTPPTAKCIDEYLASLHAALTASPPAALNRSVQLTVQHIVTGLLLQ